MEIDLNVGRYVYPLEEGGVDDLMNEINLTGETEPLRKKVVDIGEGYSIVTDYTSMVVLDDPGAGGAQPSAPFKKLSNGG